MIGPVLPAPGQRDFEHMRERLIERALEEEENMREVERLYPELRGLAGQHRAAASAYRSALFIVNIWAIPGS